MADLFDDYRLGAAWDEMLAGHDRPGLPITRSTARFSA
jgi:hypothetical protein